MSQKGLSSILIILLVIVTLAGGHLLYSQQTKSLPKPAPTPQQTTQPLPASISNNESTNSASSPSTETTNWKTYTNDKLGFSFQYPPSLIVTLVKDKERGKSEQFFTHGVLLLTPKDKSSLSSNISLFYYDNPQKLSIINFAKEIVKTIDSGNPPPVVSGLEGKPISLFGNITAYYNPGGYCVAVCGIYTWQYNSKIFVLIGPGHLKEYESKNSPENRESEKIFNQILSTFKFLP